MGIFLLFLLSLHKKASFRDPLQNVTLKFFNSEKKVWKIENNTITKSHFYFSFTAFFLYLRHYFTSMSLFSSSSNPRTILQRPKANFQGSKGFKTNIFTHHLLDLSPFKCGKEIDCYVSLDLSFRVTGKGDMYDLDDFFILISATIRELVRKVYTVRIEGDITSIGKDCFSDFVNLKTLEISSPIRNIKSGAFIRCTSLQSFTLPNSVEILGDETGSGVFQGCTSLSSVTLGENLKYIGKNTFFGIPITSIDIPQLVETIDLYAFSNCDHLQNCIINSIHIEKIGIYAFYQCSLLKQINLPRTIKLIGSNAFQDCSSLYELSLPSSITTIYAYTFSGCYSLTTIIFPENLEKIEENAFNDCQSILSIEISSKTTEIGNSAFLSCSKINSLILSKSLIKIGSSAFQLCSSLTSIKIPNSVQVIGSNAFSQCTSLQSIEFQGKLVETIGSYAFSKCQAITSFNLPILITTIEEGLFQFCSSLKTLNCEGQLTTIGSNAFQRCSMLKFNIPISVTQIGNYAFSECSYQILCFSNNLKSIGANAFEQCSNLQKVIISKSITNIGEKAFYLCSKLSTIFVHVDNQYYLTKDDVLFDKINNKILLYPSSKSGEEYSIPYGIKTIGSYSFYSCLYLKTLYISSSVNRFEANSFKYINSLIIYYYGKVTYNEIFSNSNLEDIPKDFYISQSNQNSYSSNKKKLTEIKTSNAVSFEIEDDSLSYYFEAENQLFSVTGSGKMKSFEKGSVPWKNVLSEIKTLIIDDYVESIGNYAFEGCSNLKTLYIGNNIQEISKGAFLSCNSLKIINLPKSLITIGENAFEGCSNLINISIETGLTTIKNLAFSKCSSINIIILPKSLISIGNNVFNECSNLQSIVFCGNYISIEESTKYLIYSKDSTDNSKKVELISIKTEINGITIKNIEAEINIVILGNKRLIVTGREKINNYENINNIEWKNYLRNIEEINIGGGITIIGDNAFYEGINVKELYLSESIISIGINTFYKNKIEKLRIPNSLEMIGFYNIDTEGGSFGNNQIKEIGFAGNSLKIIGDFAFHGNLLERIYLPSSLIMIGKYAFSECSHLRSVTNSLSFVEFSDYSFYKCTNLQQVSVVAEVIDSCAFKGCSNIVSLKLLSQVRSIANDAFEECDQIITITFYGKQDIKSQAFQHLQQSSNIIVYVPKDYTSNEFCGFKEPNLIKDISDHSMPFTNYYHYADRSIMLITFFAHFFLASTYIINIVKQ